MLHRIVQQITVLGPLLPNLHNNDMATRVHIEPDVIKYAYDTVHLIFDNSIDKSKIKFK